MNEEQIKRAAELIERRDECTRAMSELAKSMKDIEFELACVKGEALEVAVETIPEPPLPLLQKLRHRFSALELTDFRDFVAYIAGGETVAVGFYKYSGMGYGSLYAVLGDDLLADGATVLQSHKPSEEQLDDILQQVQRHIWETEQ